MNIGDLFDNPIKVLIIAVVFIVFFGAKKLPDAARSLGKSMRILKTEVQGLHEDDAADKDKAAAALPAQPAVPPTQHQIDQLQQQIRDLQQQPAATAPAASEAATVNGAPRPETTQRTQQAG
jgi:sec-independent protein translocase protein TatA